MAQIQTEVRFSIVPEWLLDADVSDRAVRVYAVLARYADSETLEAFPSRQTIAERCNCHVKSVDRAIDELVAIKALKKIHRKAKEGWASNLYVLRRVGTPESLGGDTTVARVGTPVSLGRDTTVHLTRTTEREPVERELLNDMFDTFWSVYPIKKDKPAARRAFEKALKRTDLETLVDGAKRYRDDPNREPRFTKYPATWLNNDGWDNGPEVSRRKLTGAEQGMALVKKYQDESHLSVESQAKKVITSFGFMRGIDD